MVRDMIKVTESFTNSDVCSYDLALLLMQRGINIESSFSYKLRKEDRENGKVSANCPTYAEILKWLLNYGGGIWITIGVRCIHEGDRDMASDWKFWWQGIELRGDCGFGGGEEFDTPEDAMEAALLYTFTYEL